MENWQTNFKENLPVSKSTQTKQFDIFVRSLTYLVNITSFHSESALHCLSQFLFEGVGKNNV
jgi:hypothetical protein